MLTKQSFSLCVCSKTPDLPSLDMLLHTIVPLRNSPVCYIYTVKSSPIL